MGSFEFIIYIYRQLLFIFYGCEFNAFLFTIIFFVADQFIHWWLYCFLKGAVKHCGFSSNLKFNLFFYWHCVVSSADKFVSRRTFKPTDFCYKTTATLSNYKWQFCMVFFFWEKRVCYCLLGYHSRISCLKYSVVPNSKSFFFLCN